MKTQILSLVALASLAFACAPSSDVVSSTENDITSEGDGKVQVHVRYYGDENVSLFEEGAFEPFATVGAYGITATTIDVPPGTYLVRGQHLVGGEYELLAKFTVTPQLQGATFYCGKAKKAAKPSKGAPAKEICSTKPSDIEPAPLPAPEARPEARKVSIELRFDAEPGTGILTAHRPDGSTFTIGPNEESPSHDVTTGDELYFDVWNGGDKLGETSLVIPLETNDGAVIACRLDGALVCGIR